MDGPALSPREQQILQAIEADLRGEDTELDRRLSRMRLGRLRHALQACVTAICLVPLSGLVLLVACTLGLLAVAVQLRSVGALAVFGVVWTATVVVLAGRASRWLSLHRRRG
jgi:uncharacterized membrane protein (DUF485 family)